MYHKSEKKEQFRKESWIKKHYCRIYENLCTFMHTNWYLDNCLYLHDVEIVVALHIHHEWNNKKQWGEGGSISTKQMRWNLPYRHVMKFSLEALNWSFGAFWLCENRWLSLWCSSSHLWVYYNITVRVKRMGVSSKKKLQQRILFSRTSMYRIYSFFYRVYFNIPNVFIFFVYSKSLWVISFTIFEWRNEFSSNTKATQWLLYHHFELAVHDWSRWIV